MVVSPDNPADAAFVEGTRCLAASDLESAETLMRRALELKPDHIQALSHLGVILRRQNKLSEAIVNLEKALALAPDDPSILTNSSNVYRQMKLYDRAIDRINRALAINPRSPVAQNLRGLIHLEQKQFAQAETAFKKAISLNPSYGEALMNLGNTHLERKKYQAAESAFRRAVDVEPDFPWGHNNLAQALRELGRHREAAVETRRATELMPNNERLFVNLGNIYKELGLLDDAEAAYRKSVELKPGHTAGYMHLVSLRRIRAGDPLRDALLGLGRRSDSMDEKDRIHLHFAIANLFDEEKNYDMAFHHYSEGNRLKRRVVDFNPDYDDIRFKVIPESIGSDFLKTNGGEGYGGRTPVFVLGMPRSGTTLVERIIGSHFQAHGAGELELLNHALANWRLPQGLVFHVGEQGASAETTPHDRGMFYARALAARAPEDADRIVDKMPSNFIKAGLIHVILPNAAIIHCMRDPVDTCLSCFRQNFEVGQGWSYDLSTLGGFYRHYFALMKHWHAVLPTGRILDVRYEDVVNDPEGQARRIIDHIGLKWDPACLSFHEKAGTVRTASVVQVRQPIYKTSMQAWRRYEKYLGPLFEALGDEVLSAYGIEV